MRSSGKAKGLERNLSEGSVIKQLIIFAAPFLLSNIIQALYSVADMIIVGNFSKSIPGEVVMAGVNNGSQATVLITNAIIGLCVGGTVLIGQYFSAGKKQELHKSMSTLFSVMIIASIIITIAMIFLCDPLLRLMRVPEDCFAEASSYLRVTMIGNIFIFGYNALACVMRGLGDSKNPLKFVGVACFVNIGLDLLLVSVFDMAAFGAAIATVVSQAISMVMCIIYLRRNNFVFDFSLKSFRIDKQQLKLIFRIGTPTALNNVLVSISFIFIVAFVNDFGTEAAAAVGAVGKLNGFAILPAVAMSSAIASMAAHNFGVGKTDRAVKTMLTGMVIAAVISYAIFAVVKIFPEPILKIFNDSESMLGYGKEYLASFSYDYLFVPVLFCLNGLYTGAGKTLFAMVNGLMSSILFRVPVSYILGFTLDLGLKGIGLGAPAASGAAMVISLIYFFTGKWKKKSNIVSSPEI